MILAAHVVGVGGLNAQQPLDEVANRLAEAWRGGDVAVLGEMMVSDGILLDLEGASHAAVGVRQARAALGRLLEDGEVGDVRIRRTANLGGTPSRGYVELEWTPRPGGRPAPASNAVFLGLRMEERRWKLTEVRVLRHDPPGSLGPRNGRNHHPHRALGDRFTDAPPKHLVPCP